MFVDSGVHQVDTGDLLTRGTTEPERR